MVNFGILTLNCIICANQGFKRFSQYLYVLQHQRQIRLLSINTDFCQILSLVGSSLSLCRFRETLRGFEIYHQKLIVQFLSIKESIEFSFFKFSQHQLVSDPSHTPIQSLIGDTVTTTTITAMTQQFCNSTQQNLDRIQ